MSAGSTCLLNVVYPFALHLLWVMWRMMILDTVGQKLTNWARWALQHGDAAIQRPMRGLIMPHVGLAARRRHKHPSSESFVQVGRAVAAENLGDGFLVPPLIRFVNGEEAYLSMSNGGPRAYFNIEDHISKSSGVENTKFQVRVLSCAW